MAAYSAYVTSGATAPHYSKPEGTVDRVALHPALSETSVRVARWLASEAARRYDNRWVLLDDSLHVLDEDASAVALTERHSERTNPLVVFVQRPRVRLG